MSNLRVERYGDWMSNTQIARVEGSGLVELYASARPSQDCGPFPEQARSMYENLFAALVEQGATQHDVITERVFLSDVDEQFRHVVDIRGGLYGRTFQADEYRPATVFLHQPPCHPGRLCEVQAYAAFPAMGGSLVVRTLDNMPGLASCTVVEHRSRRHIHLANVTGRDGPGDGKDFASQAEEMFSQAEAVLRRVGASFSDVLRTWIYVNDIGRNYPALNRVRTEFFQNCGVARLPASTAIQGATYPRERACAMDLYALVARSPVQIEVMHSTTMNEAPAYGSSFSRGMRVAWDDRAVLYVSGTASIDTAGDAVHLGDVEGQVRRMLSNVEGLLAGQGATMRDLVTVITYLAEPHFLDAFKKVWQCVGAPIDIPSTVSVARVCRPEWLCEIEGIAVKGRPPVTSSP